MVGLFCSYLVFVLRMLHKHRHSLFQQIGPMAKANSSCKHAIGSVAGIGMYHMPKSNFLARLSIWLLPQSLNKCSFAVSAEGDPVVLIIMKIFVVGDVWVCIWVFISII